MFFSNADITNGFPANSRTHQRPQKVPVVQGIPLVKGRPEADDRGIFLHKGSFFQIFRKVNQHLPFRIPITAESMQSFRFAEKKACHFQLPGREKTGICGNVLPDSCVYFVPQFCQEHSVFRIVGNFFDITAIHCITGKHYSISFIRRKEVFLV